MDTLPAEPSLLLELGFVGLVASLTSLLLVAVRRAASPKAAKLFAIAMFGTLGLSGALALTGALAFGPLPPPLMVLVTLIAGATFVFSRSRVGRSLARDMPLIGLVGFQAFRIPVELLLHRAHHEGVMPVQMSYFGYNFDVVTGVSALVLFLVMLEGEVSPRLLLVWNWMGLALLVNVVTIAILSMPTPLQVFFNKPSNVWVTTFPFVWLPAFLVPCALLGHLLLFRRLTTRRISVVPQAD